MVDGHFVNWAEKPSLRHPFHYQDGTSIFMAPVDLGLGGNFLEQSVPQESPGDDEQPGGGEQ